MLELSSNQTYFVAAGTATDPVTASLTNTQLQTLITVFAQSTIYQVTGSPVGLLAKAGVVLLNVAGTAVAQFAGNYFFPNNTTPVVAQG